MAGPHVRRVGYLYPRTHVAAVEPGPVDFHAVVVQPGKGVEDAAPVVLSRAEAGRVPQVTAGVGLFDEAAPGLIRADLEEVDKPEVAQGRDAVGEAGGSACLPDPVLGVGDRVPRQQRPAHARHERNPRWHLGDLSGGSAQ
nr:hypothetical protein GCM10020092_080020 [Actinoplanes digitatis]